MTGATDRVREYYGALRAGEPLAPFFAPVDDLVKFGVSERLVGYEAVADGLRDQTETTTDWAVESHDLRVTERERHAWFSDRVSLSWTDTDRRIRFEFETRWSGTLELRDEDEVADPESDDGAGTWQFVGMHVSAAREI
ncbi:nuclear transport factor 2 family protein [Halosimplex salinum]|uniref:nuclear transport factor 2 family protein n=1 Tax=Halosimplex salinum TaxID=1710538 RepID=UPI000F484DB4|nr:nuclear transport factor 2 family protein [Halosimplex salinum]